MIKFFLKTLLLALLFIGGKSFAEIRNGKEAFEVLKRMYHKKDTTSPGVSRKSLSDIFKDVPGCSLDSIIGEQDNLMKKLLINGECSSHNYEEIKKSATTFLNATHDFKTNEARFNEVLKSLKGTIASFLDDVITNQTDTLISRMGNARYHYSYVAKTLYLLKFIENDRKPNDEKFIIKRVLSKASELTKFCHNPKRLDAADSLENVSRERLRILAKKTLDNCDKIIEGACASAWSAARFNKWAPNKVVLDSTVSDQQIFEETSKMFAKWLDPIKNTLNQYLESEVDTDDGIAYWNAEVLELFVAAYEKMLPKVTTKIEELIANNESVSSDLIDKINNNSTDQSSWNTKDFKENFAKFYPDKRIESPLNDVAKKELIKMIKNIHLCIEDLNFLKQAISNIEVVDFTGSIGSSEPYSISGKALTLVSALAIFAGYQAFQAGKSAWTWFKKKKENKPEETPDSYQPDYGYYDDEY